MQLDHRGLEYAALQHRDLTQANFEFSNLTNADLGRSTLTNADLSGAVVAGARFRGITSSGFTQAQLASTASYQAKDLHGIGLSGNDLNGWDFSGQNLTSANLSYSNQTNANFTGANLTSANLSASTLTDANLAEADLRGVRSWSGEGLLGNTIDPDGLLQSLALSGQQRRQIRDDDGVVDSAPEWPKTGYWLTPRDPIPVTVLQQMTIVDVGVLELVFDADASGSTISFQHGIHVQLRGTLELTHWVLSVRKTWFGDADLNGEFNSSDFVQVFQAGKYETTESAGWSEGDWDGEPQPWERGVRRQFSSCLKYTRRACLWSPDSS